MSGPKRNYIQKTTGKKVIGVTTGLGVIAKPALVWWGYKQGLDNYERLSAQMARLAQKYQGIDKPDGLLVSLQQKITNFSVLGLYEKRDEAANAGTLGHEFIENHLQAMPDPKTDGLPPKIVEKAEGCYLSFLDWEKTTELEVIGSEVALTSEEHPFGGTIDHVIRTALTMDPNGVEILDVKTAKDIYFEAKVQVAAYTKLWQEHNPDRPVFGIHIIRLGPNGEFTHRYWPNLDPYWPIFLHCLDIHEAMKALGERL